jgi:hypothetical protein
MREDPTPARTAQTPASSVVTCRQGGRVTHGARRARWRCDSLDARASAVWSARGRSVHAGPCRGRGCRLRQVFRGLRGVQKARPVAAPVGMPCPPAHAGLGRLTSAANPAGPRDAGRDCRSRRGRSVRAWPARPRRCWPQTAALSGRRPTRRPRRCPVPAVLAELWPGRPDGGVRVDNAAACAWPLLQEPVAGPAAAGRRSQRRQARQRCRRAGRGGGRARPSWPDAPAPGTASSRSAAGGGRPANASERA